MKIQRNKIIFLNLFLAILFLIPSIFCIDLTNSNYSSLSINNTNSFCLQGYLYLLLLGIFIGLLLAYETFYISNNKIMSFLCFLSLFLGTVIPHHVPYNIQGNLHLLFAYFGFSLLFVCTLYNCFSNKIKNIYVLLIVLSIMIYLKYGMVTALSQIVVMLSTMFVNLYMYLKCR